MKENKNSISKAKSYTGIDEFWDKHDLGDFWDQTKEVDFEVDTQSETRLFVMDLALSEHVAEVAKKRGISVETLINLWIQEKLKDEMPRVIA